MCGHPVSKSWLLAWPHWISWQDWNPSVGGSCCCKYWKSWVRLSCPQSNSGVNGLLHLASDSLPLICVILFPTCHWLWDTLFAASSITCSLIPARTQRSQQPLFLTSQTLLITRNLVENQGQQFPGRTWGWVIFGKVDKEPLFSQNLGPLFGTPYHVDFVPLEGPQSVSPVRVTRERVARAFGLIVCWSDHLWLACLGQSSPSLLF